MVYLTLDDTFPVGMVATTVSGLAMAHQPNGILLDVTNDVRLGGFLACQPKPSRNPQTNPK